MKYIDAHEAGGPDVLFVNQGPEPELRPGEVLINVEAAGINRPDLMQRAGLYPPPAGASPIMGLEVAGTVAKLGEGAAGWQVGDEVCALTNGGGYAEFVAVPAGQCLPLPKGLSFAEAAALPETFFTVWANVFDRAQLQPGEIFLVHGGSGGIGSAAIQMAKAWGAKVITTAGSEEKCAFCSQLGADRAINYREEDFVEAVKDFAAKDGADVILDMVGGDYVQKNLQAAATDGRIVNIAFQKGSRVELDLMRMMLKRITLSGSTLRARDNAYKAQVASQLKAHIWPLIEQGHIKPQLYQTLPFTEAAQAHQLLDSGNVVGKVVLEL